MRLEPNNKIDRFRRSHPRFPDTPLGVNYGVFQVGQLRVIASYEMKWEHVSVSLSNRCPTWDEMCKIKDLFWGEEETVIQFHPPHSEYVNQHKYCLHLWREIEGVINLPPTFLVGRR